jgi:CubicO group peptidase (beta-lactamase class C family)
LLNHTSGIADDADEEAGEDYSALFVSSPNYAIRQCADFLKNFAYKEPYFKAGTNVRYNNCAFVLLGLALEKVTGMDYRSYVTKNIFQACDMTGTKFCAMDEINENTAEGYQSVYDEEGNFTGYKKNIYSYPPIGTPDGGAYSTAEDLDKFIRAIKNNVILSDSCSKALFEPHCRL